MHIFSEKTFINRGIDNPFEILGMKKCDICTNICTEVQYVSFSELAVIYEKFNITIVFLCRQCFYTAILFYKLLYTQVKYYLETFLSPTLVSYSILQQDNDMYFDISKFYLPYFLPYTPMWKAHQAEKNNLGKGLQIMLL